MLPYWEAHKKCYSEGGHLARIENAAMNHLIGSLAEPLEHFPEIMELLWIEYTDILNEGTWVDYRNNTPGFDGFDQTNITAYDLKDNLMLNHTTQNCAVINFIRIGVWNDEWCSARWG